MSQVQQRQVLGVISNHHNNKNVLQTASTTVNDNISNLKNNKPMKATSPLEFEIFHESVNVYDRQCSKTSCPVALPERCLTNKENERALKNQKENSTKQQQQKLQLITKDEEDEQDEEEQDDLEEESEEGISRLNIGGTIDAMDCSAISSMYNNQTNSDSWSPMVTDDKSYTEESYIDNEEHQQENVDHDDDDEDEEDDSLNQERKERNHLLASCLDYKDDILKYMRSTESQFCAKPNYLKKQADITSSMRSILVDWLVEVSEEYNLNTETLYLATSYTDRFLSKMSVLRGKLQLVGTAAIYVAAKYEEITPPDVSEFVYITDDTYTMKQILRMEHLLLKSLDFRMSPVTTYCFLQHFLRFSFPNVSQKVENLAKYIAELTLIDADQFLVYTPSQIAASALYLSMHNLSYKWSKETIQSLGLSLKDLDTLKPCINDMHNTWTNAPKHPQQAIREKYKSSNYESVSNLVPDTLLPDLFSYFLSERDD
jgi:hypothetical protein